MYETITPFSTPLELLNQEITPIDIRFFLVSQARSAVCPKCQQISNRKHRYVKRQLRDLPIPQKKVYARVSTGFEGQKNRFLHKSSSLITSLRKKAGSFIKSIQMLNLDRKIIEMALKI